MISIITITFNNYDELIKTLNSIPTEKNVESVVINGGDCEKTKDFLKTYNGKSLSEKDKGIADAFNKGIKISSGDFIMFLNSGDVLLDESFLRDSEKYFLGKDALDFIHSNLLLIDDNGNELFMKPIMKNIGRGMPYLHPTMIVRKNLFEKIGLFNADIKIAMDYDWIARLEKNSCKGMYLDRDPVVKMDGRGKSIINESEAMKECYRILKKNNLLNFKNIYGFTVRYLLFFLRTMMMRIGLKKSLVSMKKIKYSK
jgi:glycosyltransferase involved in cell wall biosynthesis